MRILFLLIAMLLGLEALPQKKGKELIDSLLQELPKAKPDSNKVLLLQHIAQVYGTVNTKEGFKYAAAGLDLAAKLQWQKGIAGIDNQLGLLAGDTGNNNGARAYFELSFAINKKQDAKPAMIANLNNIGRCYQRENNYTKASEYYFKGMTIAEDAGNTEQMALVGTNLTALFIEQQDYKKAAAYAAITLKAGKEANAPVHIAKAYEMQGIIDMEQNDTPAAKSDFQQALSIDEQLGNRLAVVSVLTNLSSMEPNPENAIPIFLKIEQMLNQMSAPASQNTVINLANLGVNYYTLGMSKSGETRRLDLDKAQAYLEKAETLSVSTQMPGFLADIKQVMANVQEAKGDYKAALTNFKAFTTIKDSVFSQENKNKIAALESQRAIDLKNKEIENKELLISNQRKGMGLLISVVGFLAILGTMFYRQSIKRKRTNTVLVRLNHDLDEANKVKSKFFGILSHDLRSPLANLINFLELQKRKPRLLNPDQVAEREQKIGDAANHLLDTMEAMLLWSKGQMEHFKPTILTVPVNELFDYLQKFFAAVSGIAFIFSNKDNLHLHTDENYLKCIMLNLTANAVKALQQTPGAQISWQAWRENEHIFLSITDNGPGARQEQLKALYDETAGSSSSQGLGLHIIRDLAKAIHCSVIVSPDMQEGAQFVLSLEAKD
jgi:signal transduction histidine kinase